MAIRPRAEQDIAACVALLRTVYEQDGYPADWPRDPEAWIATRRTLGAWVSEHDGQVIGHIALTETDPERSWSQWQRALNVNADQLAVVRRLFVAPAGRRRGVASALLACAREQAAQRERGLVLDVAEHNKAAIAFWERHGWRHVGRATLPLGDEGRALRLVLFAAPTSH